jgi:hypothetical protein
VGIEPSACTAARFKPGFHPYGSVACFAGQSARRLQHGSRRAGSALKRTDHRAGTGSEIRQTASAPKVAMKTKSPATGINNHLAWKTLLSMMEPPEKPSGSTAL